VPDRTLRTAAEVTSMLRGCTCDPDLRRVHRHDGTHAVVGHDDDCPAADTGISWVLAPTSHRRPNR
jgi:hypothetical protein